MNVCNLKKTFEDYKTKGWDRIFVLLDAHGTIIPSGTHDSFSFINPQCKEVLQWMSNRPEFRLILWTSSHPEEVFKLGDWLEEHKIDIDYINKNPEAKDTTRACFMWKPYYNMVIDDRAGFEPETDWAVIKNELISLGEWNKL
jgi:hypothetical protein